MSEYNGNGVERGLLAESDLLERQEVLLKGKLDIARNIVLQKFPALSGVEIQQYKEEEDFEYTGGYFRVPYDENEKPKVRFVIGDLSQVEALMITRKASVKVVADKLGIPIENMSTELLLIQIFLHEVGHAYEFVSKYSSRTDSREGWRERGALEEDTLPVPGLAPSILKSRLQEVGGMTAFFSMYPELDVLRSQHGVRSEESLLAVQEIAYKKLPKEVFADDFACMIMKEYSEELDLRLHTLQRN